MAELLPKEQLFGEKSKGKSTPSQIYVLMCATNVEVTTCVNRYRDHLSPGQEQRTRLVSPLITHQIYKLLE